MAKIKDLQKKSTADLIKMLKEKRENLQKVRFGTAGSGSKDVMEIRNTRKDVARLLTELNVRGKSVNE